MKKLIILVMTVAMPLNAMANCVDYEYAEIKNMSKEALLTAIKKNHDQAMEALQESNNPLKKDDTAFIGKQNTIYNHCEVQREKLNRILKDNFPGPEKKEDSKSH